MKEKILENYFKYQNKRKLCYLEFACLVRCDNDLSDTIQETDGPTVNSVNLEEITSSLGLGFLSQTDSDFPPLHMGFP